MKQRELLIMSACICIPALVIQYEEHTFSASHYVFVYGLSGFTTFLRIMS
jgi:hypothetical protein